MSLIKDGKVYRTIEEQVAWLTKIKYNSYQKQEVNEMVETLNQKIDTKAEKQEVNQIVATLNQKIDTKAEKQEVNQTIETLNQKINTKQDKLSFDATPTENSTNPVTSGGVYNAIETEKQGVNQTIETLNQKINTKQDKLSFDATPTENSTNPVTSGGVYNALSQKITLSQVYPIGSIYISVNNTSPASLFGGSWEKIKDKFLLGSGDTYTNGESGGEATHKLTYDEMPMHIHYERFGNTSYTTWEGFSTATQQGSRTVTGVELPGYNYSASKTGTYNYLTTGYSGNDKPHNNMPPYLVVNMWKRIG